MDSFSFVKSHFLVAQETRRAQQAHGDNASSQSKRKCKMNQESAYKYYWSKFMRIHTKEMPNITGFGRYKEASLHAFMVQSRPALGNSDGESDGDCDIKEFEYLDYKNNL